MPSNCIAIIPARGGSKRLPGKNLRPLGGLPLIGWTISAAKAAGIFSRVIVSTDDPAIADASRELGADVPWLRSPENATDTAGSVDVVREVVMRLAEEALHPEAIMLLQPTSPFRDPALLRDAWQRHLQHGGESVVSVCPASPPPHWCFTLAEDGSMEPWLREAVTQRSQDLPAVFCLNGSIYLSSTANLLETGSFYSRRTQALPMHDEIHRIDIDTPFDFMVAETAVANGLVKPPEFPTCAA